MADSLIAGSCLCGAVQFQFPLPTLWCAHCHCTLCQRAHGAGVVTWVGIEADSLQFTRKDTLSWYASSVDSKRGFCSTCGSTLFFRSERWPGQMHIVRANIHGEIDRQPSGHAYYDAHVQWMTMGDNLPRE